VRREVTLSTSRLAAILGLAVLSHVLIDATNVFGVVPWYPFSTTWVFGDVSFIFEPWLWLLLGVPVARQAATATPVLVLVPISVAILVAAAWRLIPAAIVPALAGVGAVYWYLTAKVPAHHRMTMALGGAVALFVVLAGLSAFSREQFVRESGRGAVDGVVLDVVLEPDPATPWCWSGLVVSSAAVDGSLKVRRGTVSLLPRVWPAASCVSAALFGPNPIAGNASGVVWTREWTMPLERLRRLDETDCAAAAWFRFSRAPMVIAGSLRDLRLENPVHDNFTALALERTVSECPSNVPPWTPPRADVLKGSVTEPRSQ
jgi:inner membrane protein